MSYLLCCVRDDLVFERKSFITTHARIHSRLRLRPQLSPPALFPAAKTREGDKAYQRMQGVLRYVMLLTHTRAHILLYYKYALDDNDLFFQLHSENSSSNWSGLKKAWST